MWICPYRVTNTGASTVQSRTQPQRPSSQSSAPSCTLSSALLAFQSLHIWAAVPRSHDHIGILSASQSSSLVFFVLGQGGLLRDKDIFVKMGKPL